MTEESKKAFDFAADTIKQLITLASGIIALTITFSKDILGSTSTVGVYWMYISWLFYIISIAFGILALLSITGTLEPQSQHSQTPSPSIYDKNIRNKAAFQIISFLLALIFTVIFGIITISNIKEEDKENCQTGKVECCKIKAIHKKAP
ncbi:hypothetical protein [Chryseobacterium taichungense]|uniref:hypothetical protein n=1 Tax=Chryseobacterium taichungense TaxID=295069 RepID=UPI0028AB07D6|nr:hypothetical protein [Chryseobacterium taichungense]